jgi:DNA modification methylase
MNPERFTDKPDLYQKLRIKLDSLRNIDVYEKFRQVSSENIQRMELLRELADSSCTSRVISKDARNLTNRIGSKELLEDESVDLVLTSPPYAGAQKYIRSSRISLNWFGMGNPDSIRNLEKSNIGREDLAQKDRIISEIGIGEVDKLIAKIALKDTTRACIVSTYLNEMSVALKEAVRVLKKGGYMVLVVGPNKVSGYDFDTPKYLRLIAERYGMHTELLLIDSIKKYGMLTMRNKTAGMIMVEHVIVMKK